MFEFVFNPIQIAFQFICYLILDNIVKYFVTRNKKEHRFDILLFECFILGFLISYLCLYHFIPYVLLFFFTIHLIGTIYSSKDDTQQKSLLNLVQANHSKVKTIPKEYLYNFHLKPTNDFRLQQTSNILRPGIMNPYGTTCSLNSLLQSFASLNTFCHSLHKNLNLSKYKYEPIVSVFVDLLSQLRHDHRTNPSKPWSTLVDTSKFISIIQQTNSSLLNQTNPTDICELFQCLYDLLNNSLSKQTFGYSNNVINQIQNSKLSTYNLESLSKLFSQTETDLHEHITLDTLDSQTSLIIQYIDLTWLLHQIQLGSIMKQTFSGQILHAYCCDTCSHVRFRTEPFQILTLAVNQHQTTLEKLISQLTKIEFIDTSLCSNCSNRKRTLQENFVCSDALSPIVTSRRQYSDQIYASTPISSSTTTTTSHPLPSILSRHSTRMKSQQMLCNYPEILCVQLKRFSYDRLSRTALKLKTPILIQPNRILDLSSLHYTTWLGLRTHSPFVLHYRLLAVCLHLAENSLDGHCVCLYRTEQSQWYLSDDEHITQVNQIEHLFQTSYVTENCYLLFYEKC